MLGLWSHSHGSSGVTASLWSRHPYGPGVTVSVVSVRPKYGVILSSLDSIERSECSDTTDHTCILWNLHFRPFGFHLKVAFAGSGWSVVAHTWRIPHSPASWRSTNHEIIHINRWSQPNACHTGLTGHLGAPPRLICVCLCGCAFVCGSVCDI